MQSVRIDEKYWGMATASRRAEWQAAIRSLLEAEDVRFADGLNETKVHLTEQRYDVQVTRQASDEALLFHVAHDTLRPLITEYIDVVRQLAQAKGMARIEALDMAKKVVHDKAGRLLRREMAGLGMNLPTARRLFTLFLVLKVDTTRIVGVHGHRRIK